MKTILIGLVLLNSVRLASQPWVQLADFPGTERDDGSAFVINNKAYCLSGLEVGWQCTRNGFVFDGNSETWSVMAALPAGKERQYATAFSHSGKGYVLGGLNCSGSCLNDFFEYDPVSNSWLALPNFPGSGRQGMSSFVIGNKVFVAGGRLSDNSTIDELWQYDFNTQNWTQKNDLPFAMWRGTAFVIDTTAYICYGKNNATHFNHQFFRYRQSSDSWQSFSNLNLPARNYIATAVCNGKACLYGGQDSLNTVTNNMYVFNPADSSLSVEAGIPTNGRKGCMSFSTNDVFYVVAGLNANQTRIRETWKNADYVGVKEHAGQTDVMRVFPNPFNESLTVNYLGNEDAEFQLLEASTGKLIFETQLNAYKTQIHISSSALLPGVYLAKVSTKSKMTYYTKLVCVP